MMTSTFDSIALSLQFASCLFMTGVITNLAAVLDKKGGK